MNKKSTMKIGEVASLWLDYIKISVKKSTLSTYSNLLQSQIMLSIGEMPIQDLSKDRLDDFIIEKFNKGRSDGKGGLSAKTVLDIWC